MKNSLVITVLFQTIHSNIIKEKDEEIERLPTEIENLKNDKKKGKRKRNVALHNSILLL